LAPQEHPAPPRPRPPIFYYVFTLLYLQDGQTRKFRHYLPCGHNPVYLGINDIQRRHIYAAGSFCLICPFCEEVQITHLHLNLFQCPNNEACPKVRKIHPTQVNAKIEHDCVSHQAGVPHPNDLSQYATLPCPTTTPFQFTYHTTLTQDPTLLADAIFGPSVYQMTPALVPTYNPIAHGPVEPCCARQPPSGTSQSTSQQPPPVVPPPNRTISPPPTAVSMSNSTEDPANKFQQMKQQLLAERANLASGISSNQSHVSRVPPNSPETINVESEVEESREEVLAQQYEQRERSRVQTGGLPSRRHATPPPT
jgi:hypothetical protein